MQTGLSRDELLARITKDLPEAVDKLTPDGQLPAANPKHRDRGDHTPRSGAATHSRAVGRRPLRPSPLERA
ncbi:MULTISPECIES: YidB family protein [unclassified Mesorhizobium]|uniref:YidB family protein n=1 Tax=unclassified Mesorhizobium TaxID=325217 RepID=UPI001FDFBDB1|nr:MULTISPECIES: YidB family protein [unclassified Mesorhizobium]